MGKEKRTDTVSLLSPSQLVIAQFAIKCRVWIFWKYFLANLAINDHNDIVFLKILLSLRLAKL